MGFLLRYELVTQLGDDSRYAISPKGWAFLDSLSNPNRPVIVKNLPESNLEIHWDVFAGELADYLLAAFAVRAAKDGVKQAKAEQAEYFRSHLERGINQLQNTKDLHDLFKRAKGFN